MNRLRYAVALLFVFAAVARFPAEDKKDDGFVPMFNGTDLTGWVNVNCAPGTFFVKDGMVITTGKPTGYLRTTKQYENFIADFEWMHVPSPPGSVGNSGFFVWADPLPAVGTGYTRGIEVQVLVNLTYKNKKGEITATSQGDLFSIWGATCVPERPHPNGSARCLPSENRAKGENEWNHYVVEANDGVIKLAVNGKVVSSVSKCSPRKGYLALESEGSECRFRNLKIKELPSTNPKPAEIADVDQGFKNLFTGLDLSGWKADEETKKHWTTRDGVLVYDGTGKVDKRTLRTEKEFSDAEFITDFRFPAKDAKPIGFMLRRTESGAGMSFKLSPDGTCEIQSSVEKGAPFIIKGENAKGIKPAGQWNRLSVGYEGVGIHVAINGLGVISLSDNTVGAVKKGAFALDSVGPMEFRSLFVRELKK